MSNRDSASPSQRQSFFPSRICTNCGLRSDAPDLAQSQSIDVRFPPSADVLRIGFKHRMKSAVRVIGAFALLFVVATTAYGFHGYFSARADAAMLSRRADVLIAQHRGPEDLGPGRIQQLLMVEDPGFWSHEGTDWTTPGSGLTTLTQSVGKRVGFKSFHPGLPKIRLVGYAKGLANTLSKRQILALYLDTVWMGRGPTGPMTGLFNASEAVFHRPPSALNDHQFLSLVAVLIAPRKFSLASPNADLEERTARIERLVRKKCQPAGLRDVWLEGCANPGHAIAERRIGRSRNAKSRNAASRGQNTTNTH